MVKNQELSVRPETSGSAILLRFLGAILGWRVAAAMVKRGPSPSGNEQGAGAVSPLMRAGYWGRLWGAVKALFRAIASFVDALFGI